MSKATGQLTPHFRITEFSCRDGSPVPSGARAALREWCVVWGEPLRERFGPVRVTSGYRTRTYNAKVGGEPASFHLYDRLGLPAAVALGGGQVAADVIPARGRPADWQRWAEAHRRSHPALAARSLGGVGRYDRSGFVHLDTGPRRSWVG